MCVRCLVFTHKWVYREVQIGFKYINVIRVFFSQDKCDSSYFFFQDKCDSSKKKNVIRVIYIYIYIFNRYM